MKLKCRINGKDYDIVQGATFIDNFNETLDSATICLDQIYKIDNLQPYDDVFIWNADEEFVGYGNVGDIIEFDYDLTVAGDLIGSGAWSQPIDLGADGISVLDSGPYFELYGQICQIWAYRFYGFTSSNENTCRYDVPEMSLTLTINIDDGKSKTTVVETGFKIESVSGRTHGLQSANIVLKNENYSFACTYSPDNENFLIAKTQPSEGLAYLITNIEVVSSSYKTQDIDKIFNLDVFLEDFSSSGITNFDIDVLYRGADYLFKLARIENVASTRKLVVFENAKFGAIGFIFERLQLLSPNMQKWGTAPKNSVQIAIDTSNIFGEVDMIAISNFNGTQSGVKPKPSFYKHLLVDSFSEEMVGLETGLYKYTIDLFSETKRLERIILPNISITQSLVQEEKRSCWFYLEKYLNAFSPKYKKVANSSQRKWRYVNKYSMSESGVDRNGLIANLKEVFDKVICPEFSLTNPSLKDLLAQIMIAKDMIPVVRDDVVYGMDIGNVVAKFDRTGNSNFNATNFTVGSMSSADFATDARREHGNALSQENSARLVEYLGFRTPNSTFLTLDELVLETRFPIYKINSIKMCYYKKAILIPPEGSSLPQTEKICLCKQDITPLVLQNVVRNTLSTNWRSYRDKKNPSASPHDYSDIDYSDVTATNTGLNYAKQYKICTIGYDIGSNKIAGWGEKYGYLDVLWFKAECSYIENIVNLVDHINAFGSMSKLELKGGEGYQDVYVEVGLNNIIAFDGTKDNIAKQIKSIVFEVDYDALYNGTVIHGKDNIDKDDILTADNCSAALTVLESDGLFEREKMNRLGNKIFKLTARYDRDNGGSDVSRVQNIGTYDEVTDSIIYTREYQIYDNVILANYEATHEYVLKNYFTTVWAKYRTYSLMSYGESIRRAENIRKLLVLSKDAIYYENAGGKDDLLFGDINTAKYFLSFVTPTVIDDLGKIRHNEKLNCGYFIFYNGANDSNNTGLYLSDVNAFASGTSLCFNIATYDNVSGGNYIDSLSADLSLVTTGDAEKAMDYKTTQKWWNVTGSASDAYVEDMGFYVCHLDNGEYFHDYLFDNANVSNVNGIKERYLMLPKVSDEIVFNQHVSSRIGVKRKTMCKDNKEVIDMTMQFSYIAHRKDNVLFSPWICKLNDLIGFYDKFDKNEEILTDIQSGSKMTAYIYDTITAQYDPLDKTIKNYHSLGPIVFKMKKSAFETIGGGDVITNATFPQLTFSIGGSSLGNLLASNQRYEAKGSGTLSVDNVMAVGENYIDVRYNFGGSYKYSDWFQFLFWRANERTNAGSFVNTGTVRLTKVAEEAIDGDPDDKFYYFKGTMPANDFKCYYLSRDGHDDGGPWAMFACFKDGDGNVTSLDTSNSLVCEPTVSAHIGAYKSVRKNMFAVASSQKVEQRLEFNYYKYDLEADPPINTFPNNMYVDKDALVENVFSIFQNDNGYIGLLVKPSIYKNNPNVPFQVKSIQYYYRDNNTGTMYFVFGVNLPEISEGNVVFDNFNIYLSAISKRCMDVYDENHNVVGKVKNMLDDLGLAFDEQYYDLVQALPSEYEKVQFLEADGRQVLDIDDVVLDNASNFEFEFMAFDNEINSGILFGRSGINGFAINCGSVAENRAFVQTQLIYGSYSDAKSNVVQLNPNQKYKARVYIESFLIDNTPQGAMEIPDPSYAMACEGAALFGCKLDNGDFESKKFNGRIYEFKVYNAANLTHHFVPCIRIADQKPGMYDLIAGKFYANVGLGDFKYRF